MSKVSNADPLVGEVYISEAYLTALFWNHPELYSYYNDDKLNMKMFGNKVWAFFFRLGREISEKGITVFDDISTYKLVQEMGIQSYFEKYGGYNTIEEVMIEVKGKMDNFDGYYLDVMKYNLLRNLRDLFGEQVQTRDGNYDYHKMDAEEIHTYWLDKVNKVQFGGKKIDEQFLLEGLREAIKKWNEDPDIGLEFFDSPQMTKICNGWATGQVYIQGGFSGAGKTSITFNKVVMSCIKENEPLVFIANEMSKDEMQKLLLITAMGISGINKLEKGKKHFRRQRLNEGGFEDWELEKMENAVEWIEELSEGVLDTIKFVYLEEYTIDNVKSVIRHYAHRGVKRFIIDTAKPTEGDKVGMERWQRFTMDFEEIYKMARPDGGGLDLAIWTNVQLADSALGRRFLDEHAFGDSKKIKNVASVVFLFRTVFDDEYEGEKNELEVRYWTKDEFSEKGYSEKTIKLKREYGPYVLMFTSKNRRGKDNRTGLDVLVMKPDYGNNTWREIGWCKVMNDRAY